MASQLIFLCARHIISSARPHWKKCAVAHTCSLNGTLCGSPIFKVVHQAGRWYILVARLGNTITPGSRASDFASPVLELNSAGQWPYRNKFGCPWSRMRMPCPLKVHDTLTVNFLFVLCFGVKSSSKYICSDIVLMNILTPPTLTWVGLDKYLRAHLPIT